MPAPIIVTGAAGFNGFHVAQRLLRDGHRVVGVDSFTPYYDVALKEMRFAELLQDEGFVPERLDLAEAAATQALFERHRPTHVVHLAAQPGVRQALITPHPYVTSNIVAFLNILEGCRHTKVAHLVYASSSSVYGANRKLPFSEHDPTDHPVSLYAATKKSNEMMAHSYSHLFGLSCTGLRFFTVYGPWGRPDMALFAFTKAILEDRPIQIYNHGRLRRDFTYIDDIVEGVVRIAEVPASPAADWSGEHPDPATSRAPYRLYNIGNDAPIDLMDFIEALEQTLGKRAVKEFLPMQAGDVVATHAEVSELRQATGFRPATSVRDGVARFVEWYKEYFQVR
jgi:UDP-glucuronate 4-epimerase